MAETLTEPSFMEHEMEEEAASIKHEIEDGQMNTHNLTTEVKIGAKKRIPAHSVDFF